MNKFIYLTLLIIASLIYSANSGFSQNALCHSNDVSRFRINDHDTLTMVGTLKESRVFFIEDGSSQQGHIISQFSLGENSTSFPDVELHGSSKFSIFSGCDTCGNNAVIIEYKIINRGNKYIIAGYTKTSTDRNEASVKVCDVNYLSGKAELTKNDIKTQVNVHIQPIELSELDEDFTPVPCVD